MFRAYIRVRLATCDCCTTRKQDVLMHEQNAAGFVSSLILLVISMGDTLPVSLANPVSAKVASVPTSLPFSLGSRGSVAYAFALSAILGVVHPGVHIPVVMHTTLLLSQICCLVRALLACPDPRPALDGTLSDVRPATGLWQSLFPSSCRHSRQKAAGFGGSL
jgi:hypothetical protein